VADAADRLQAGNHRLDRDLALALAREGTRPVAGGGVVWRFDPRHRTPSAIPFHFRRLEAFLRRLACPVQLVDGAGSGKLPDHAARQAVIPGARHAEIADAGHMVHQDQPAALAAVVARFLAETGAGPPA
jgi:pimeloyl-ACP methyl ester carboxylesterase